MARKMAIPQEAELEQVPQDNDSNNAENQPDILESWTELQRVLDGASIDEIFEKGWKPLLKSKPNGKQYITLRLHGKDENGQQIDTERGLGLHNPENPERWETLLALYEASKPALPSVSPRTNSKPLPSTNKPTILQAKVARLQPLGPSVNLELETISWYMWAQKSRGYPETLDTFINECVSTLFRDYFGQEFAVVKRRKENS